MKNIAAVASLLAIGSLFFLPIRASGDETEDLLRREFIPIQNPSAIQYIRIPPSQTDTLITVAELPDVPRRITRFTLMTTGGDGTDSVRVKLYTANGWVDFFVPDDVQWTEEIRMREHGDLVAADSMAMITTPVGTGVWLFFAGH